MNRWSLSDRLAVQIKERFVKREFKRADSPLHNEELLLSVLKQASAENKPILFLMYWGKGVRRCAGENEEKALKHLKNMFDSISSVHRPGCYLTIIATDTHINLNGYDNVREYFDSLKVLVQKAAIPATLAYMSEIATLPPLEDVKRQASSLELNPQLLRELTDTAKKHSMDTEPQLAAKAYFFCNQIEKEAVARRYHGHVFLSYNSNKHLDLLPASLPIFFMSSIRRGTTDKPWYNKPSADVEIHYDASSASPYRDNGREHVLSEEKEQAR